MSRIFNLEKNPFTKFSAEEELEILDEIFYEPRFYSELKELLLNGSSRFILGQRGQGKSAIIHKLFNDLSQNHTLPLIIGRYDEIPLKNNKDHILYQVIQTIVLGIARKIFEDASLRKKLSKEEKVRLAFFIELFYDQKCADGFIEAAKEIKQIKSQNRWKRFVNRNLLQFVNMVVNGAVNITSQWVRQSIGLDNIEDSHSYQEYLKELKERQVGSSTREEVVSWGTERLQRMLVQAIEICKRLGFHSVVILFDKIDEFSAINADVQKVTEFTEDFLSDTDLLYQSDLSIVFSLWSEVKRSLNTKGIRFDKFKEIDIRWEIEELERLINQRLSFYSLDKSNPVTMDSLFPNKVTKQEVLELSNHSPRALIRLLGEIYNEDYTHENLPAFTLSAVSKGMERFCKNFDYESQNPSKVGRRNDFISWINRLLRLRKPNFSISEYNSTFQVKNTVSSKHIEDMIKLNLLKENYERTANGETLYEVVDPKIKYLISRGVLDLES